jgi:alpha-tubulin suppressor-like RCC1 family protein
MKNGLRIGLPVLILVAVATLRAADVVSIWGGARHVIILKTDGTVWTWGDNSYGKLGIGQTNTLYQTTPVEVHDAANVSFLNSVKLIMGGEETQRRGEDGWHGLELGLECLRAIRQWNHKRSWVPTQTGLTANPPLTNAIKLGGRPYFTLAVKSDGTIWAWGMNQYGQMGNGTVNSPVSSPQVTVPVMVGNSAPGDPINNPL